MSERMTSVHPRNERNRTPSGKIIPGFAEYGRKTRAEMIDSFRKYYQQNLEEAQAALSLADEDLIVKTYVGALARKNMQEVTE